MANTKLKKKKKGVIGANGLNSDADTNDKLVTIWSNIIDNAQSVIKITIICVVANI